MNPASTLRQRFPARIVELGVGLGAAAAFGLWTWLTLTHHTVWIDRLLSAPQIRPRSALGQVVEAFALATHPVVVLLTMLGVATFSFKRRMRRLGTALAIGASGIPLQALLALWIGRPRPTTIFQDSLSYLGSSYPASHVTSITLASWMLVTLTRAHRRPTIDVGSWWLVGVATTVLTCTSQWLTGMAHPSDLVGGILLGACVATLSLSICGIDSILSSWARLGLPEGSVDKRAAVILNPTKFEDLSLLRRRVEAEVLASGWQPTIWLETTREDPGHKAAQHALSTGVDLVLIGGGDGTVRAVCSELAGSQVPVALLPSGTGNLLARNLGIPLDTDSAIRMALHGTPRAIDVMTAHTDLGAERFVVMAGMGLDAQIMESTKDGLKKLIRSGAYAVAALKSAVPDPFSARVSLDEDPEVEHRIVMALVGNVGTITGGVTLFPRAQPDDGQLDLMLASPDRVTDWAKLGAQVLTGKEMPGFQTVSAAGVRITSDRPVPVELDGDTIGETRRLDVEVTPGALLIVRPE